jgi:hypothetical protein
MRQSGASHAQAGIEEFQRGSRDIIVPPGAVDAGRVDAGFRPGIPPELVALVDENLVVDQAGHHVELGVGDVFRRELGVFLGRRLGVARADDDVGRDREMAQAGLIHAEARQVAGRHRHDGLHAGVPHVARRPRIERHLRAQIGRHHRVVLPRGLIGQEQIRIDPGAADPQRGEPALRVPGHPDLARVDMRAPGLVLKQPGDVERDVARALPELAAQIQRRQVVGVGAVVVERGDDIAVCREGFGEPGVKQAVAAGTVGEHDQRALHRISDDRCVHVQVQVDVERHVEGLGGTVRRCRRIEQRDVQMPPAAGRVDIFHLPHPDGIQTVGLCRLGRCRRETRRPDDAACRRQADEGSDRLMSPHSAPPGYATADVRPRFACFTTRPPSHRQGPARRSRPARRSTVHDRRRAGGPAAAGRGPRAPA